MSRERARRREERERESAVRAAARAAEAERRERRARRRRLLTDLLPARGRGRPHGLLAERRRRRLQATVALLVLLNVVAWLLVGDLAISVLLVVVSLLVAPVVHLLLWRR